MKFFRRKKKQEQEEHRRYYRRAPGRKHALGVKVNRLDGLVFSGEVQDLSAGGVAITFTSNDPELDAGDILNLTFNSLHHGGQVVAEARVCSRVEADGAGRVRYGFEFCDAQSLFEGLDPWFHKFFNRRREIRVRPALDTKLEVTLTRDDRQHTLAVHDVSVDGVGVTVGPELSVWMSETQSFDAALELPKGAGVFSALVHRVHMTEIRNAHRCGLEFDKAEVRELQPEAQALLDYCKAREKDMARWDSAYE